MDTGLAYNAGMHARKKPTRTHATSLLPDERLSTQHPNAAANAGPHDIHRNSSIHHKFTTLHWLVDGDLASHHPQAHL